MAEPPLRLAIVAAPGAGLGADRADQIVRRRRPVLVVGHRVPEIQLRREALEFGLVAKSGLGAGDLAIHRRFAAREQDLGSRGPLAVALRCFWPRRRRS